MSSGALPCVRIVEDEAGTRKLFAILVENDGFSCRAYESAEQFMAHDNLADPGCVLVDLELNGLGGAELVRWISLQSNPLPSIVVTGYGSARSAVQCLKSGALDFLEKPIDSDRLLELIRGAVETDAELRSRRYRLAEIRHLYENLSPREKQVMLAVSQGLSTKLIATQLGIAAKTVEHHRGRVMTKMKVDSVAELVRAVVELNLTQ